MNEIKPESFCILPENIKLTNYNTGNKKKIHYFFISKQPTYTTCLCKKFYTNFISQFYKIKAIILSTSFTSSIDIFLTISNKCFNMITDKLLASPISKLQLS